MPGNVIVLNESIQYYVGDSKMPELMKWLKKNGVKDRKGRKGQGVKK